MPIMQPGKSKLNGLAIREDGDGTTPDGYEQGGLIYFMMDGKQMVLVVRERKVFDSYARGAKTLLEYTNSVVSDCAYEAAKAIEQLIPRTKRW